MAKPVMRTFNEVCVVVYLSVVRGLNCHAACRAVRLPGVDPRGHPCVGHCQARHGDARLQRCVRLCVVYHTESQSVP